MKKVAATCVVLFFAAALRPAGPDAEDLLGALTRDRILEAFPGWHAEMDAYTPLWAAVERIRTAAVPVRLELFLSTSQEDSRIMAGRLFKILDQVSNPNITAWYMGLPGQDKPLGLQAAAKRVDKTPTLLVLVEGRETGRVVGMTDSRLEEKLASFFPEPPPEASWEDDDLLFDLDFFRFTPHTHLNIDCTECHIPRSRGSAGSHR